MKSPNGKYLKNEFTHMGLAHYADNGRFGPSNMIFSVPDRGDPKSLVSKRTSAQYLSNNTTLNEFPQWEVSIKEGFRTWGGIIMPTMAVLDLQT